MPQLIPSHSSQPSSMTGDYPSTTKRAAGMINHVLTEVHATYFLDKIMVLISQEGRLAQWIHVPLEGSSSSISEQPLPSMTSHDSLLPMPHLTPRTLLGGSTAERETTGQLYATQIASAIAMRNPQENRMVLLGLGLSKVEANREVFYDTMDLVLSCL
ncbi:MAG: hypothetical protein HETSPECPRED_000358 [Heterodermia speciosa]|uniref:Proteasome assembly chaperone 3 n=1 Tax=Heterodermia speciosa TaxID=116794 RepID=A0A8H3EQG3_9LECA|nr:MAG: hypothetical protein HETSPECPRED_000358 [Heterodermia speciosa]